MELSNLPKDTQIRPQTKIRKSHPEPPAPPCQQPEEMISECPGQAAEGFWERTQSRGSPRCGKVSLRSAKKGVGLGWDLKEGSEASEDQVTAQSWGWRSAEGKEGSKGLKVRHLGSPKWPRLSN